MHRGRHAMHHGRARSVAGYPPHPPVSVCRLMIGCPPPQREEVIAGTGRGGATTAATRFAALLSRDGLLRPLLGSLPRRGGNWRGSCEWLAEMLSGAPGAADRDTVRRKELVITGVHPHIAVRRHHQQ